MHDVSLLLSQYLLLLVSCTHQSMPIILILSVELRRPVPNVETIQLVLKKAFTQKVTSAADVHNLN